MKYRYFVSITTVIIMALASCKKYDTKPAEFITENYAYDNLDKNAMYAQQIIYNIYSYLNRGFNRINGAVLDAGSDDAIASAYGANIEILSKGRLNAMNNPDDNWASAYACIRRVNKYLANEGVVPADATMKQYWRAEARFMRAYSYFELIKRYGGVPLIGNKVYSFEENINLPRNTYEECVNYIVSECSLIKDSLRAENAGSALATDWGRITRGTALALKARTLLYAASPLNNPSNDLTKWQAAADAAKAVIDLNYYQLVNSFPATFLTRANKEIILAYQRGITIDLETQNAPVGFGAPNQSYGYISPTQELVDAFPMANGRTITDIASGYDATKPYLNRDQRLKWTVFFNDTLWLGRRIETFDGGFNKPGGLGVQTRTSYYMRKFLGDFSTSATYANQTHNFPIIRYADILLNYAEAVNELGNQTTALAQLVALRSRAGIAAGSTAGYSYGLKTSMTQVEMREAIRNERRIELAFEEHRFWDIRRWKIAETVANRDIHGMKIEKTLSGFTYTPIVADRLYFTAPKHYVYPIPFQEVNANPAIKQNPGY